MESSDEIKMSIDRLTQMADEVSVLSIYLPWSCRWCKNHTFRLWWGWANDRISTMLRWLTTWELSMISCFNTTHLWFTNRWPNQHKMPSMRYIRQNLIFWPYNFAKMPSQVVVRAVPDAGTVISSFVIQKFSEHQEVFNLAVCSWLLSAATSFWIVPRRLMDYMNWNSA